MLRLLLVEDDPDRIARFTAWCPPDARLVVARGGGRALGLLERDPGRVYAGLLLDHDLPGQAVNDAERLVTGIQVVQAATQGKFSPLGISQRKLPLSITIDTQ